MQLACHLRLFNSPSDSTLQVLVEEVLDHAFEFLFILKVYVGKRASRFTSSEVLDHLVDSELLHMLPSEHILELRLVYRTDTSLKSNL